MRFLPRPEQALESAFEGGLVSMKTVTKKELIERISVQTGQKRTSVKRIVQCFLNNVIAELSQGNRLEFRDFGVFEARERAARIAQNPKTLERVPVPAKKTVKFKIGRLMKQALDGNNGELAFSVIGQGEEEDDEQVDD